MIRTGSSFACDMYHLLSLKAGVRGVVCGPQTHWPPQDGGDDGSVRRELDSLLASNNAEDKVQYGVATHGNLHL